MNLKSFASTRSAQIATAKKKGIEYESILCLHTLRADCNVARELLEKRKALCLHTLRADCNLEQTREIKVTAFASTRSAQIATCPATD